MELDLQDLARRGLRAELARLDLERARIAGLLEQIEGASSSHPVKTASASPERKRRMSPEGRLRIQEAVRRRWERVRAEQAGAAEPHESGAGTTDSSLEPTAAVEAAAAMRKPRRIGKRAGGRKK